MAAEWRITGIDSGKTKKFLGHDHMIITVDMPVSKQASEGVEIYIPVDTTEEKNEAGESVWVVPAGTTIFRTVLQPVILGDALMGAAAIPSAAPASLIWNFVEPMALPAA